MLVRKGLGSLRTGRLKALGLAGAIALLILPASAAEQDAVSYLQHASRNAFVRERGPAPPLEHAWTRTLGGPVSYALVAGGRVFVLAGIDDWPGSRPGALDRSAAGRYPLCTDRSSCGR